jgi:hypothetical protein
MTLAKIAKIAREEKSFLVRKKRTFSFFLGDPGDLGERFSGQVGM